VHVREEWDVVIARNASREVARRQGLPVPAVEAVATAVSEVARNIVVHAGAGEVAVEAVADGGRRGVRVVARDDAPGIEDVERALQDGYSTGKGLGLGLPSARRLMDEFALDSAAGRGTTVTMTKWAPREGGR
jgi:serine/threonine-protein kinase RsbT